MSTLRGQVSDEGARDRLTDAHHSGAPPSEDSSPPAVEAEVVTHPDHGHPAPKRCQERHDHGLEAVRVHHAWIDLSERAPQPPRRLDHPFDSTRGGDDLQHRAGGSEAIFERSVTQQDHSFDPVRAQVGDEAFQVDLRTPKGAVGGHEHDRNGRILGPRTHENQG